MAIEQVQVNSYGFFVTDTDCSVKINSRQSSRSIWRSLVKRRNLLKLLTCFSLGTIATPWVKNQLNPQPENPLEAAVEAELLSVFSSLKSAKFIGEKYLKTANRTFDRHQFLAELCTHCQPNGSAPSIEQLRSGLRSRQQQDFAEGRIVELDGWMLSETEVKLCALAALSDRA
jgi:hypothetical protein